MAYAAVVSLMQILEQLLSPDQEIPICCPKSQIQLLYNKLRSCHAFLKKKSPEYKRSKRRNSLAKEIREAVWLAEDVVESCLASQSVPPESGDPEEKEKFSEQLSSRIQEIESVIKKTEEFADDVMRGKIYSEIIKKPPSYLGSPRPADIGDNKIVGFNEHLKELKYQLIENESITALGAIPIIGMSGIGKTTLATLLFNDPLTEQHFEARVWAAASHASSKREILLNILDSMEVLDDEMRKMRDGQLEDCVTSHLEGKKYLVVLDNMTDTITWMDIFRLFPFENKGSKIIVTTTIEQVAELVIEDTKFHWKNYHNIHRMNFLNESDSWILLCEKVFGKEPCPPALVEYGKKIAKNCQGLPLAIIAAGKHLANVEKTVEYWKSVAESGNSLIAATKEAVEMRKQLSSGYKLLPEHLKACFFYMAVFAQNYEIPVSKLSKLWVSEGFLEPVKQETLEEVVVRYVKELVNRNLVLVSKQSSTDGIKTCVVHSAMWLVCSYKSRQNKFLCIVNRYNDCFSPEFADTERRLSIGRNVLFGIRDVYNALESLPTVRSLLCVGPDHPYPVRVCLGFNLLRVLDTLSIRFYKFPIHIFKLFMLKYLALTYNGGEIPAGLSKLRNLQFLILYLHENANFSGGCPTYLPMEIWDMKELRHLQVVGSDLPSPPRGASLPNLLTLVDVTVHSCTKEVFKGIQKLKKLGVRIVLKHPYGGQPLCPFDHLHEVRVESVRCVVVNPAFGSQVIALPNSYQNSFKKLALSGCGLPWEDMTKVAQIPYLEVLKLRCHAFRGPMWTTENGMLDRLDFLLLEGLDLENWSAEDKAFSHLKRVSINQCYKLKQLPSRFDRTEKLKLIEFVDCSPPTVEAAKKLAVSRIKFKGKGHALQIRSHSSLEGKEPQLGPSHKL